MYCKIDYASKTKNSSSTFVSIRHVSAGSVFGVEPPSVERTLDAVAYHAAHDTQVGSEVGTKSVEHVGHAVLGAECNQIQACKTAGDAGDVKPSSL